MLVIGRRCAFANQVVYQVGHHRVQPGRGFVVEHDLRIQGDARARPIRSHAPGKLRRHLVGHFGLKPHFSQPFVDSVAYFVVVKAVTARKG